jgi:hypothetical protein
MARQAVLEVGATEVVTACLVQHSWASPAPTFAGLMSDELIIFPWNRVLDGRGWRLHPELESALPALGGPRAP